MQLIIMISSIINTFIVFYILSKWKPQYPGRPQTCRKSHNVVSSTSRHELDFELTPLVVICTDFIGSCKSKYCTIITTTASYFGIYCEVNIYSGTWKHHNRKHFRITALETFRDKDIMPKRTGGFSSLNLKILLKR